MPPQVANSSGVHDSVVDIAFNRMEVTLELVDGFYHGKEILYISTEVSDFATAGLLAVAPMTAVQTPQPNHSHIIDGKNFGAIWWLLNINLVNDRSVWPDVDGNCPAGNAVGDAEVCLNSVDALEDAQAAGQVSSSIPTNFFLFFDSGELRGHSH